MSSDPTAFRDKTSARLRRLHLGLAAVSALLLFTAQQLYHDTKDAQQDARGDAESIMAFLELAGTLQPNGSMAPSAGPLLKQAVRRFDNVLSATYCDGAVCLASSGTGATTGCEAWSWASVCADAQSAVPGRSIRVAYSLVEAHGQTLRDFAYLSIILAAVAAVWSAAAGRMRSRVAQAERATQYAASHDVLTKLPNRAAFERNAQDMLHRANHEGWESVLLYVDLDGFKAVNDNLGHHVGSLVLQAAGQRLQACLDAADVLARVGGDEFGVLLGRPHNPGELQRLVAAMFAAFEAPVVADDHSITVGLSIGAARLNAGVVDFNEAMRRADVALYEAKRQNGGVLVQFSEAMDMATRARYRLQHALKTGIAQGQLFLEYQPQVDGHGVLKGVEALVRWRHPTRGLVRPDDFISVAEQSGLIGALGLAVVRMACTDLVHARQQGMHLPYISINVSPKQLADVSFVDTLLAELQPHDLGARDLELEVTESSLVQSKGTEEQAIRRLADLGFRIAVDDFGTGYSSLSRLHSMPVDKLKIDRSFVTPLPGGKGDRAIPESILSLAQKLGLKTVAEGVETPEQAAWLYQAGCALMQGYYFARPMPLEKLLEWTRQRAAVSPQSDEVVWAETASFEEA